MSLRAQLSTVALTAIGLLALSACSASDDTSRRMSPSGAGPMATGGQAAGGGGGGSGGIDGAGNSGGDGGGIVQAPGGGFGAGDCSADLRSITKADGTELEACKPDEGCFEGKCIDACESARLSKGTLGCDFYSPTPPFGGQRLRIAGMIGPDLRGDQIGPCHAAFLANAWPADVMIEVELNGVAYDAATIGRIPKGTVPTVTLNPLPPSGLPQDEVAVLFLTHRPGVANTTSLECPIAPAKIGSNETIGSDRGQAFHIRTSHPVSAYDIVPYGGAGSYLPSATLLSPSPSWGDNYVAAAPHAPEGPQWIQIVGMQDGTEVAVLSPVDFPGGGALGPVVAGAPTTYMIEEGEVIQLLGNDPSGVVVSSSAPVGVFTGNVYLAVSSATSSGGGMDSAHQQLPPVGALGSEYVGANVVTRLASGADESTPYRIVGVVDGTKLSYDPAAPSGAPASLEAGEHVQFESTDRFVVRAQDDDHPFLMTHYLSGGKTVTESRDGCTSGSPLFEGCVLGDEDWVMMLPPHQFLSRYVFFVDPTYGTSNLVVTRTKAPSGFEDVFLQCAGGAPLGGWMPVGTGGVFEVAHVELLRKGEAVTPGCNVSGHVAHSKGQFGVEVWGTDFFASYGYPAGGNVGTINKVRVPVKVD